MNIRSPSPSSVEEGLWGGMGTGSGDAVIPLLGWIPTLKSPALKMRKRGRKLQEIKGCKGETEAWKGKGGLTAWGDAYGVRDPSPSLGSQHPSGVLILDL